MANPGHHLGGGVGAAPTEPFVVRNGSTLIELLACQPKPRRRQARAAFTLIELLVVIAIISLLVSILLPSLTAAQELARRSVCMGRLKAMGLTLHMYAHDQDGRIPAWRLPCYHLRVIDMLVELEPDGTSRTLYPDYAEDPRLFYCPNKDFSQTLAWSPGYSGRNTWGTYYYLGGGHTTVGWGGGSSPRTLEGDNRPIMQDMWCLVRGTNTLYDVNHAAADPNDQCAGCNVLLLAGEVRWAPRADIDGLIGCGTLDYRFARR